MNDDEHIKVQLWRERHLTGVMLCYQVVDAAQVGVHNGGSYLFLTDTQVNDALTAVHIRPGLVKYPEDTLLDLGVSIPQLEQLGLKPRG